MARQSQETQIRQPRRLFLSVLGPLSLGFCLLPLSAAHADIVRFTNGRTLNVESVRFEGDVVILTMTHGELRTSRDLVAELLPDETPEAHAVGIEALAASPSAAVRLSKSAIVALVNRVAARVGVDEKLAHAVVGVESNYNQLALSSRGAMGLMQIMPAIAQQYALDDPFDPEKNLEAGMQHLRGLLGRYGSDVRRALAAYNAGEGAVTMYGGVPPYRETQTYVQRIMTALRQPTLLR